MTALNKQTKELFITQVMEDVPHVDYAEQLRDLCMKAAVAQLPTPVLKLWKDSRYREYVSMVSHSFYDPFYCSVYVPGVSWESVSAGIAPEELEAVGVGYRQQFQQRRDLRSKLAAVVESCRTHKQLRERLPEFSKYMPKEPDGIDRTVPVVANVVTSFMEAGWPKDQVKETA